MHSVNQKTDFFLWHQCGGAGTPFLCLGGECMGQAVCVQLVRNSAIYAYIHSFTNIYSMFMGYQAMC